MCRRTSCHQPLSPSLQAYSAMTMKPAASGRLVRAGVAVLVAGALLLLLGAVGAFYFWNNNEKHVGLILLNCLCCSVFYDMIGYENILGGAGGDGLHIGRKLNAVFFQFV